MNVLNVFERKLFSVDENAVSTTLSELSKWLECERNILPIHPLLFIV